MPNWCSNTVRITGPNPKIEKLKKAIEANEFLHHLFPMPAELKGTTAGPAATTKAEKAARARLTKKYGYDNWYVAFDGKNITLIWVGYEGERKTKSLGLYGATTSFDVFQNYYRDRGRRFQQFSCDLVN